jgi:MFS family permease
MATSSARQEWAVYWPVPAVSLFGIAGSALFPYSSGVFLGPIVEEFGWSRADFYSAFVAQTLLGLLVMPMVGWAVDRFGPRAVALLGVPIFAAAFASLGLAQDDVWLWRVHCTLAGVFTAFVTPMVWVTAVVGRFHHSRGFAMAVALAGVGFASAVWPLLAAFYLDAFGWRTAFLALALTWGAPVMLLSLIWFRGPAAPKHSVKEVKDVDRKQAYWRALRSWTLGGVMGAGSVFTGIVFGLTLHLVPIFEAAGHDRVSSAFIAGFAGVSAIVGRLGAGYLLDRFPARRVGACIMVLPVISCVLLLTNGDSLAAGLIAVAFLGLATGGETDVLAYILSREFDYRIFGSIYAVLSAVISVGASVGPMVAGAVFDAGRSYAPFLSIVVPVLFACAVLLLATPKSQLAAGAARPSS